MSRRVISSQHAYNKLWTNVCKLCHQELRRFPTLQGELAAAATAALERFRDDSKKTSVRLVEMEQSYLTVDFFRKLPQEVEKGGNPASSTLDRYSDAHLRRIGKRPLTQ